MTHHLARSEEAQPGRLTAFDGNRRIDVAQASAGKRSARTARLQIVLPQPSFDRLEAIKEETEAASYAEVIRRALRLYEGLLAETREGGKLVVLRDDGSVEDVPLVRAL